MTPPVTGQLVSVASVLLAAFGFFYSQVAGTLREGLDTKTGTKDPSARAERRRTVGRAFWRAAFPLTLAAAAVTAILMPEAVAVLGGVAPGRSYDALGAAYLAMSAFWLGVTVLMVVQSTVLLSKHRELRPAQDASAGAGAQSPPGSGR